MQVLWPIYGLETEENQYPGIMSISALLESRGFEVAVVPADVEGIVERVRRDDQTLLAYSTPTTYYRFYRELNAEVRRRAPSALSLFGGPHPTFFPQMIEDEGVDAICIGEGEQAMLELVSAVAEARPFTAIDNWWVKRDGVVHRNPVRPLLDDLDSLPPPAHGVWRRAVSRAVSQAVVITGRGCPNDCSYCFNHVYRQLYQGNGKPVRRRSVEHVMRELRQLKADGCRFLRFMDDTFILSPAWVEEFAGRYRDEIALPFSCLVRANLVTEKIVRCLRDAGCFRMLLGLEAGDERVRNEILHRKMTREVMVRAARTIREAGLKLVTANILAIPGGSFQADWETLELNVECRPHFASVALLHPYPRTAIFARAEQEGMLGASEVLALEGSFGFGLRSPLRYADPREKRRSENLQKFFALATRFPWIRPIVRRLVELPPNRLFDAVYLASVNLGTNLYSLPPRIGLPILWRKFFGSRRRGRGRRRTRKAGDAC
jgi:anaerobic magnesium-protoporphyrin IX monomethyl ester cyclase